MKATSSIKSSVLKSCALGFALSLSAFGASAAPAPYSTPGTENLVEYSFTALADGDIVAYFVGKGNADYFNTLSITINGVSTGVSGLLNQTSNYGESLNFGHANAGDTVTFSLWVEDLNRSWSSDKSQNIDGANHIYASSYEGDDLIPSGLYVAFEDMKFDSDFNYLDHQFVVGNVTTDRQTPEVPVPAAVWLFGSGLVGLAGVARRRS